MKKVVIIWLLCIPLLFLAWCAQKEANKEVSTQPAITTTNEQEMVDCSLTKDPMCFVNRMNGCLPVMTRMIGSDNATNIEITILGQVNETCHFQRKINSAIDLDCYFPKGTMNMNTLDQTFGNDKGLQEVVDSACKAPGW